MDVSLRNLPLIIGNNCGDTASLLSPVHMKRAQLQCSDDIGLINRGFVNLTEEKCMHHVMKNACPRDSWRHICICSRIQIKCKRSDDWMHWTLTVNLMRLHSASSNGNDRTELRRDLIMSICVLMALFYLTRSLEICLESYRHAFIGVSIIFYLFVKFWHSNVNVELFFFNFHLIMYIQWHCLIETAGDCNETQ